MQKNTAFAKGDLRSLFRKKSLPNYVFIMRLSVCCGAMVLFSLNLLAAAKTSGQGINEIKLSVESRNESLKSVLQKLQDQSSFSIFYPSAKVNGYKNISVSKASRTIAETLDLILKGTGLDYHQDGNKIILSEKKTDRLPAVPVTAVPITAAQQVKRINGIITDEAGLPLPGVTVRLKLDKSTSTATDENGHFHIDVKDAKDILIFNFIGYTTQEIPASQTENLRVNMKPNSGSLEEVVVIGYGTTKRKTNTGAVSSITSLELSKQTVSNPITALQGRIAGMQITQDNGLPGAGVRVSIRGAAIGFGNSGFIPLYVIDGVPFTLFNGQSPASDNLNANGFSGANGAISPFSMINPEDIERIDILKDADATSIYGSRGSNGVVLITTKKGAKGKTAVNVNVYNGISKVSHFIPMMNTQEYLAMRQQAYTNSGITATTSNAKDLTVWDQNAYTDWQDWAIGGTSHTTNASATISGGDAYNTFLFSSNYRKEGTVYQGDFDANTFSGRLNVGHKSTNGRFSIDASVNYSSMNTTLPNTDLSSLYTLAPNYPIYNADGTLNWTSTNPLSYLSNVTKAQTTNLISNVNIAYKIIKGLSVKANLGYTLTSLHQTQVIPASAQNPANSPVSTSRYADNDNSNYIIEPQAEYLTTISKGKLQALIGTTFQQSKATGVYLTGTGFSNEAQIYSLTSAASVLTTSNANSSYKYNAVFGRLNYNWDEKYIVDATFRRDGSSRFGPDNRFGNFGALGGSWIFTQEDFMKNVAFLSFGKLRASYGITGNDQIPNYQYYTLYNSTGSTYSYNGTSTAYVSNIENKDLHWEKTKKLDIAAELGFFKERILFKVDFYRNRTSDALNYISLPAQSGTTSYLGNVNAQIQNKGWEFELNTTNIAKEDFRWTTTLNLTLNKNKLLSYENLAISSYKTSLVIGEPVNITKLYHYTGVNPTTGLPTFQDFNGDGAVAFADDRYIAKYGHPYYAGITNSFTYKSFQLDFTFQYNHRYGYLNTGIANNYNPFGYNYTNQTTAVLDRWMAVGDVATLPAAGAAYSGGYSTLTSSDYNWGDASYLKLKTVSLNYALPKPWIRALKMSNATVYLQGQNIFTSAKQKYTFDPETTVSGTGTALGTGQYSALPQLRTIVIGLNCSF